MVLTPKQKYRSMKLDEKSRDKSKHLSMTPNLCQRRQEYKMEKRQPLQEGVLGKLDSYMKKNEMRILPNTTQR